MCPRRAPVLPAPAVARSGNQAGPAQVGSDHRPPSRTGPARNARSAGHIGRRLCCNSRPGGQSLCGQAVEVPTPVAQLGTSREPPRPTSTTRSVCAATPTETKGMQPPVLARLESPAQASEGYPICAVQQRSTAIQPSFSECVGVHSCPPTPGQGLVDETRRVRDEETAGPLSMLAE